MSQRRRESEESTLERLLAEQAAQFSPGWRAYRELPCTPENAPKIARALLEDPAVGDVPETVMHSFATQLDDAALDQVEQLRVAHFKRLGKPMPEYPGEWVR